MDTIERGNKDRSLLRDSQRDDLLAKHQSPGWLCLARYRVGCVDDRIEEMGLSMCGR